MHADAIIVSGEHTADKTNSKRNQNERRKRENTFDAGGFSAGHMGQPLVGRISGASQNPMMKCLHFRISCTETLVFKFLRILLPFFHISWEK